MIRAAFSRGTPSYPTGMWTYRIPMRRAVSRSGRALDRDDGLDAKALEGGEAVIPLRLPPAVEARTEAEEILDALEVKSLRLRGWLPRGPLSRPAALVSVSRRRRLAEKECTRVKPDDDHGQPG